MVINGSWYPEVIIYMISIHDCIVTVLLAKPCRETTWIDMTHIARSDPDSSNQQPLYVNFATHRSISLCHLHIEWQDLDRDLQKSGERMQTLQMFGQSRILWFKLLSYCLPSWWVDKVASSSSGKAQEFRSVFENLSDRGNQVCWGRHGSYLQFFFQIPKRQKSLGAMSRLQAGWGALWCSQLPQALLGMFGIMFGCIVQMHLPRFGHLLPCSWTPFCLHTKNKNIGKWYWIVILSFRNSKSAMETTETRHFPLSIFWLEREGKSSLDHDQPEVTDVSKIRPQ